MQSRSDFSFKFQMPKMHIKLKNLSKFGVNIFFFYHFHFMSKKEIYGIFFFVFVDTIFDRLVVLIDELSKLACKSTPIDFLTIGESEG